MEMVDHILYLFGRYGSKDYIGEKVSQNEHMIQCAMLAENDQASPNLIVASLLHDIGHLLVFDSQTLKSSPNLGVVNHEEVGSAYLKFLGFNSTVVNLVKNHVKAKRYLVSTYRGYFDNLSEASKQTLIHQGGMMNEEERQAFINDPLFEDLIRLRLYDDKAKIPDMKIKSIEDYIPLLRSTIYE